MKQHIHVPNIIFVAVDNDDDYDDDDDGDDDYNGDTKGSLLRKMGPPHLFSFAIESYLFETDFTLGPIKKYHF